jgi:hypothetical protein
MLATVANGSTPLASVYDIVLVVTPSYPTAPRSPRRSSFGIGSTGNNQSPGAHLSPRQIELSTYASLGTRSYQRIIPLGPDAVETAGAVAGGRATTDHASSATNSNSQRSGYVAPYQVVSTSGDEQEDRGSNVGQQRRTQRVHTVSVRQQSGSGGQRNDISSEEQDPVESIDPSVWVKKQAFFFRVHYESYQKRHAVSAGVNAGSSSTQAAGAQGRVQSSSAPAVSSAVFMRSKAVRLDCALQLYQVPTGEVYNRITLYGAEGFRFPATIARAR